MIHYFISKYLIWVSNTNKQSFKYYIIAYIEFPRENHNDQLLISFAAGRETGLLCLVQEQFRRTVVKGGARSGLLCLLSAHLIHDTT